jgi:hypothetical protein
MRAKSQLCLLFVAILFGGLSHAALAKNDKSAHDGNLAVVIGEAGEQYPIYGAGGIKVTGGHHGFFASNMKTSAIEIDGGGISAHKYAAVNVTSDFTATAGGAYFVSGVCLCTLGPAADSAGQEVVVCNAGKSTTITYQALPGESLVGGDQSAPVVNSSQGKVDRFISDGKGWFRE